MECINCVDAALTQSMHSKRTTIVSPTHVTVIEDIIFAMTIILLLKGSVRQLTDEPAQLQSDLCLTGKDRNHETTHADGGTIVNPDSHSQVNHPFVPSLKRRG